VSLSKGSIGRFPGLTAATGRAATPVQPLPCAVPRRKTARPRRAIIGLGSVLLLAYGTSTFMWYPERTPLAVTFVLFSVAAATLAWRGVRALERLQLAAAHSTASDG
jgi:hypothetical protein